MLLFSTRLPLKESVSKEDIIELIREWITGSPHYGFENLEYTISDGDKVFASGNTTVSFKTFTDLKVDVLACRLEDREGNKCWQSDCIYIDKDGTKQFLVQLQRMVDSFTPEICRQETSHILYVPVWKTDTAVTTDLLPFKVSITLLKKAM